MVDERSFAVRKKVTSQATKYDGCSCSLTFFTCKVLHVYKLMNIPIHWKQLAERESPLYLSNLMDHTISKSKYVSKQDPIILESSFRTLPSMLLLVRCSKTIRPISNLNCHFQKLLNASYLQPLMRPRPIIRFLAFLPVWHFAPITPERWLC